ncbi:MAG: vWA domain-containing protein [Bacteroidales bacterium]
MNISLRILSVTLFLLYAGTYAPAQIPREQEAHLTRILFILDASQSMTGEWQGDRKINIARNFLIRTVDSLEQLPQVEIALRVYGHQSPVPPQDCNDTRLEVPFRKGNAGEIRQKLRFLNPKGTTPLARSLQLSASDFPACESCRNIVILITDGIEACDGDPCEVSRELQRKGIILRPFIIGIGLTDDLKESFNCVGEYFNANNSQQFQEVLGVVISHVLDQTSAQVNLLDIKGIPSETDVGMTFYDQLSGKVMYNFIHTINHRGNPDTLYLDPLVTYRLVVHTLPNVTVENIVLNRGKHNLIAADVPQGKLQVISESPGQYRDLQFLVRQAGKSGSLNWQKINREEKYLVGKYDLEIPVLPKIELKNVEIRPQETTTITIPKPGLATLIINGTGIGNLFVIRNQEMEWIYNTELTTRTESLVLQPGTYRFLYRPLNARKSVYTFDKIFTIKPGGSETIRLY